MPNTEPRTTMAGEEKTFQKKLQVILVLNAFIYTHTHNIYILYPIVLDFVFNYEVGINLFFCH